MTPYRKRMNGYIRRMAEDMQIRNMAANTIDSYTYHVDKFCQHFGKPAEELGQDEIREYQLFLVNEKKASWSSFNGSHAREIRTQTHQESFDAVRAIRTRIRPSLVDAHSAQGLFSNPSLRRLPHDQGRRLPRELPSTAGRTAERTRITIRRQHHRRTNNLGANMSSLRDDYGVYRTSSAS